MNKLIVKKFGGTSVANAERIEAVADLVAKSVEDGNEVVVVLSAMGKSTDELIKLSKDINPNPDLREYDALVSTGEQISVALLAMALQKRNIKIFNSVWPNSFRTCCYCISIFTCNIISNWPQQRLSSRCSIY